MSRSFFLYLLPKYVLIFLLGMGACHLHAQSNGLHIGAYHEDPSTNPEDPMPGLLYLNLPTNDQSFKGLMDFTFVGCQSKSVGEIKGEKINGALKGEWSGHVDGTLQNGTYTGRYIVKDKYYTGTYAVSKGKQFIKVPNCIEYYIAPNGVWSIFELNHTFSELAPFEPISLVDGVVKWSLPPQSTIASISLVDKALALNGARNAVLHQLIIPASLKNYRLPALYANPSKTYIVSVIASNGRKVVYFSSMEFPKRLNGKPSEPAVPHPANTDDEGESVNGKSSTPSVVISPQPNQTSKAVDQKLISTKPSVAKSVSQALNFKADSFSDNSRCNGVYEGNLDGEVSGQFRLSISNNGHSFQARSSSNELMTSRFSFSGGGNSECDIQMTGLWVGQSPSRSQVLWLTGAASEGEVNGRYRFDDDPSSPMMGSFHMTKINKGFHEK